MGGWRITVRERKVRKERDFEILFKNYVCTQKMSKQTNAKNIIMYTFLSVFDTKNHTTSSSFEAIRGCSTTVGTPHNCSEYIGITGPAFIQLFFLRAKKSEVNNELIFPTL